MCRRLPRPKPRRPAVSGQRKGCISGTIAIVVLLAILCHGSDAVADESELERKFTEAQTHFDERRYDEALALFEEVYRAFSVPDLLFNIAQCHRNLGDWAEAAAQFRRYLRQSPKATNAAAVKDTVRQLDRLMEAVDHLRQRRYRRALEIYEEIGSSADLPVLERDIGRTRERLGEYPEARAAYRRYLAALPAAPDASEIAADIERLQREINARQPVMSGGEEPAPIHKRWWFWGGVAAMATIGIVTAVVVSGGPPDSTLGNIGFDR